MTEKCKKEYDLLCKPFAFEDIELLWNSAPYKTDRSSTGFIAKPICYFDSRAVMDRLDQVVGPARWEVSNPAYSNVGSGWICQVSLTVVFAECAVTRHGEADLRSVEPAKSGHSDALKRAFSALGNRWLYHVELPWVDVEVREKGGKHYVKHPTTSGMEKLEASYELQIKNAFKKMREKTK